VAAKLEARTTEPKFASDHAALAKLYEEMAAAQEKVQALYARWEELIDKAG
jgi:ubiquinone biosynthesis protein UbiJ